MSAPDRTAVLTDARPALADWQPPVARAAAPAAELPDVLPARTPRSRLGHLVHRHPTVVVGGALLTLMLLMAIFAPLLWTVDPTALSPARRMRFPSAVYWFGTDGLGHDVYSRVVYGSRVSLIIGFSIAVLATVIGMALGVVAGFVRWLDGLIMRVMDGLMSIPSLLLAVAIVGLFGSGLRSVVVAITISEVPRMARLVRSVVLSLRERPYVEAAVASATRMPAIIWRHIVPNTLAPVIVHATYICASAMITEAILSFIGVGVPPITPTWGNIMADGKSTWQVYPYLVLIPAAFLSTTVLAVNLVGDGLRDALDPRAAKRV